MGGLRARGLGSDAMGWLTGCPGALDPCPRSDELCPILSPPPVISLPPFPSSPFFFSRALVNLEGGVADQAGGGGLLKPVVVVVVSSAPEHGWIRGAVAGLGFI